MQLCNTIKRDFAAVFICLRPITPNPLAHCTDSTVQYLFTQGRGGGGRVEPERRLEGQQFTKLGRKHPQDWLYLQSINSDKTPAAKSLSVQYF
jgi:hypothetical protein